MSYVCFLIFVSLHLMSYSNFVSAHEGRCKRTLSALLSCSYFFAFVVAKCCQFERNKWRYQPTTFDSLVTLTINGDGGWR